MPAVIAVLDANVLYPAPVRDLLLHSARLGLYQPKWSALIQDEWIRNLAAKRPDLSIDRLRRTKELMNRHYPDANVHDYEKHIPNINLPDPDDRHVVAVAIESGASVIVTHNQRDFPAKVLSRLGMTKMTADDFFTRTLIGMEDKIVEAFSTQQVILANPPQSKEQLLQTFRNNGLLQTATMIESHVL